MTVAGGFALSHVSGRTKSLAPTVTACGPAVRERSRTMPQVPAPADPAMCRLGPIASAGGSAWRLHAPGHTMRGPLTVVASGRAARGRIRMYLNAFARAASSSEGSTAPVGGSAPSRNARLRIMPGMPTVAARGRAVAAPDLIRRLASAPANGTWRRSALMTVAGGFALSHVSGRTKLLAPTVTACGPAVRERSRTMPQVPAPADPALRRWGSTRAAAAFAGSPPVRFQGQKLGRSARPERPASTPTASPSCASARPERPASTPTASRSACRPSTARKGTPVRRRTVS